MPMLPYPILLLASCILISNTVTCFATQYYVSDPPPLPTATRIVNVASSSQLNAAISNALPGDRILIANGNYNGFALTGLKGTAVAPIVFVAQSPKQAIISGSTSDGRNARLSDCAHLEFHGIRFTGASLWGFTMGPAFSTDTGNLGCNNIRIIGCEIDNAGQLLLKVNGNSSNIEIIGNSLHDSGKSGSGKPYAEGLYIGDGNSMADRSHDVLVQGNHFYNIGNPNNWGEAIDMKVQVYNISILDNLIENVTVNSQGAITVLVNDSNYPAGQTNPNILISRNVIHNVHRRSGGWNGTGISAGSNGVTITNNLIWNTDEASLTATKNASNTTGGFLVYNNTFWDGVRINESAIGSANSPVIETMKNNLVGGSGGSIDDLTATANDFIGPLSGDAAADQYTGSGFQLNSNSTAIGTGVQLAAVTDDLTGAFRPSSAYSFGAFEAIAGAPSTLYTVSFTAGTGGSIEGFVYQEVASGGNSDSVTAVAATGYSFTGWSGDYTGSDNPLILSAISADLQITANFAVSAPPSPGTVVQAINCGGNAYLALDDVAYSADTDYTGGSTATRANPISGTLDDTPYQSERYGAFSYDLPLANGDYTVSLMFAETYWSANGIRVFDCLIEGAVVIDDLDIHQQVGVNTAHSVDVPVTLNDGVLNISFNPTLDNANIAAIRVTVADSQPAPTLYSLSFTTTTGGAIQGITNQEVASGDDSDSVTAVASTGYSFTGWSGGYTGSENPLILSAISADLQITANFTANAPSPGTVVQAINCGGNAYVALDDVAYSADTDYTGGNTAARANPISGTLDDTPYQSERYGAFSYALPLENGDYSVSLMFAETYWTANGIRVFDCLIEGATVIDDLDIHQLVGANAAYSVDVPVTLNDGVLNISFNPTLDNANIAAIRVTVADPQPDPTLYSLTFNATTGGVIQGLTDQEVAGGGDSDSVTAVASTGYSFTGWSGDYTGSENPLILSPISADLQITANFAINVPPSPGTVVQAINCGGNAYLALDNVAYSADTDYTGGNTAARANPISGTLDDTPYQSERYGTFSYALPLENGDYTVTLMFAETYWTANGIRVFDCLIEGATVIDDLDIHQLVGANAAYSVDVPVTLYDGILNISFSPTLDNANIAAIRVTVADTQLTDTDADGMPDSFEQTHGLNSLDPADAQLDKDGDGLSNLLEYAFNLNASNSNDAGSNRPRVTLATNGPDLHLEITFRRRVAGIGNAADGYIRNGVLYRVFCSGSLDNELRETGSTVLEEIGSPIDNGDGTETVTVRIKSSIQSSPRMFIWLTVSAS